MSSDKTLPGQVLHANQNKRNEKSYRDEEGREHEGREVSGKQKIWASLRVNFTLPVFASVTSSDWLVLTADLSSVNGSAPDFLFFFHISEPEQSNRAARASVQGDKLATKQQQLRPSTPFKTKDIKHVSVGRSTSRRTHVSYDMHVVGTCNMPGGRRVGGPTGSWRVTEIYELGMTYGAACLAWLLFLSWGESRYSRVMAVFTEQG